MVTDAGRRVRLRSGHRVWVRPLRADDRERLAVAVARLSDESRYQRFHGYLRELPETLLDRLIEVDHHNAEALAAVDPHTGAIVGVARFTCDEADPQTADLAVVVDDDWQQRGLASHLLRRLSRRAVDEGVHEFTAVILAGNGPTLDLVRRLGPADFTPEGTALLARMRLDEWPARARRRRRAWRVVCRPARRARRSR